MSFKVLKGKDKEGYIGLFKYLLERFRAGVVVNCRGMVKDMYILPLKADDSIPEMILPFSGPGTFISGTSHKHMRKLSHTLITKMSAVVRKSFVQNKSVRNVLRTFRYHFIIFVCSFVSFFIH